MIYQQADIRAPESGIAWLPELFHYSWLPELYHYSLLPELSRQSWLP